MSDQLDTFWRLTTAREDLRQLLSMMGVKASDKQAIRDALVIGSGGRPNGINGNAQYLKDAVTGARSAIRVMRDELRVLRNRTEPMWIVEGRRSIRLVRNALLSRGMKGIGGVDVKLKGSPNIRMRDGHATLVVKPTTHRLFDLHWHADCGELVLEIKDRVNIDGVDVMDVRTLPNLRKNGEVVMLRHRRLAVAGWVEGFQLLDDISEDPADLAHRLKELITDATLRKLTEGVDDAPIPW